MGWDAWVELLQDEGLSVIKQDNPRQTVMLGHHIIGCSYLERSLAKAAPCTAFMFLESGGSFKKCPGSASCSGMSL